MNRESIEAFSARWLNAICAGNYSEFESLAAPDALDVVTGQRAGPGVFQERARAVHEAFADLTGQVEQLLIDDERERIAWRWTLRGRQRLPFLAEPSTGRTITLSGVNFQRLERGRVSEHFTLFDALGAVRQMRGA